MRKNTERLYDESELPANRRHDDLRCLSLAEISAAYCILMNESKPSDLPYGEAARTMLNLFPESFKSIIVAYRIGFANGKDSK